MLKRVTIAAILLVAATSGKDAVQAAQAQCEGFRILADGREVRLSPAETARLRSRLGIRTRTSGSGRSTRASAFSSGSSSSASSVSVSSSSRGGGTSRSSATVTDGNGNRVTTIQDRQGCRIIVDER